MKRLRIFFTAALLLCALPVWRFTDLVAIVSPFEWPVTFTLTFWFATFLAIPLKLLFPKIKPPFIVVLILLFAALSFWSGPLSPMASKEPIHNHCGSLSYTGTFYPLRIILSEAHRDDLEARNQMCWVRKLISKVPTKFESEVEVKTYTKIIQDRLLRPEIKFRGTLPLIGFLYFRIHSSSGDHMGIKDIYDSLQFWAGHYTEEISLRSYSVWSWPHSEYIQWEYGLIERNWQDLIDNIVVE